MNEMTICAQLYTLRDYGKTPDQMRETLLKVGEMGYTAVQLSGWGEIDAALLQEYCEAAGVRIICSHNPEKMFGRENIGELIRRHKLWGAGYAGIGGFHIDAAGKDDDWVYSRIMDFCAEASGWTKRLAEDGICFTYHNHAHEFHKVKGERMLDIIAANTPFDMKFIIDSYWVQAGGRDPAEQISELKGRVDVIHAKDYGMPDLSFKPAYYEIGYGNLNWNRILNAASDAGCKYVAVELDECLHDPFVSMKMSYDYLASKGLK